MRIVVVFVLMNPQLFPNLSDISRVNLEAVLFFNVLQRATVSKMAIYVSLCRNYILSHYSTMIFCCKLRF